MLTSDTHIGFHHVMGEWLTTFGGWSSRLAATYGYGDQSFDTGSAINGFQRYHRLYGREDLTQRLAPSFTLVAGVDVDPLLRLGGLQRRAPARGTHARHDHAARRRELARSLYDTAPAVYVEGQWDVTPRLRLVPGLRFDYYHIVAHRQVLVRSAPLGALRGDAALRDQGQRRPLPRAPHAAVPRPARSATPNLAAPLGRPVPARHRARASPRPTI